MKSILVVGGGLIGAASALRLQAAGVQTVLIDPGEARRAASFGNAGHIGTEQVMPWSTWANLAGAPSHLFAGGGPLDFRWRDIGLWAPWSMRFMAASMRATAGHAALSAILRDALGAWLRLAEFASAPEIVRAHGHNSVWMSPAKAQAGLKTWRRMPTGTASYRDMTDRELQRYEGVFRHLPVAGIVFAGTGQVRDPQIARDEILRDFASRGGEIEEGQALRVSASPRAIVTLKGGKTRDADAVLIAAGAWSGRLLRPFGVAAPVIGERGYSIQSREHAWPEHMPTTIVEDRSVVLTLFTNGLRATSFLEFGNPSAQPDVRKWRRLQQHLDELGVKFAAEPDRWMGPRPTLPDYLPAVGRLKRTPNVFYAFGHHHLGLTMCAITAELVTALATGKEPAIDLQPFRIERFG